MEEPSRGAFIDGSVDYNGHIDNHNDMVRQVGSTNGLRTRGKLGVRQYSWKGVVFMIETRECRIDWEYYSIFLETWFVSFHIVR
jgi:hypothetical protein